MWVIALALLQQCAFSVLLCSFDGVGTGLSSFYYYLPSHFLDSSLRRGFSKFQSNMDYDMWRLAVNVDWKSRIHQPVELCFLSLSAADRILADVNGEIKLIRRRRRHLARMTEAENQLSLVPRKERPVTPSRMAMECENASAPATPIAKACDAPSKVEKPVFTAKQVADFCQRKLKEREEELRVLFDQILNERMTGMLPSSS